MLTANITMIATTRYGFRGVDRSFAGANRAGQRGAQGLAEVSAETLV